MKTYQKITVSLLISACGIFAFSCKTQTTPNANANVASANAANSEMPTPPVIEVEPSYAQTPTEAYKAIYEAVKAKNAEKVKSHMTQPTLALMQAQASMQKKPFNEMFANGLTMTTFAEKLPEIRDERIKGVMGAIEVYSEKEKKWEDLPFMFENGGWKLAVGEIFSGKYESPGKGQAQKEMEASNKMPPMPPPAAGNTNAAAPPPANK